jgi:hypothetical protein
MIARILNAANVEYPIRTYSAGRRRGATGSITGEEEPQRLYACGHNGMHLTPAVLQHEALEPALKP